MVLPGHHAVTAQAALPLRLNEVELQHRNPTSPAVLLDLPHQGTGQLILATRGYQKAECGRRRGRTHADQFGVVGLTDFIRHLGEGEVEHELTPAVVANIERDSRDHGAVVVQCQVGRSPPGFRGNAPAALKMGQPLVGEQGGRHGCGESVPRRRINFVHGFVPGKLHGCKLHMATGRWLLRSTRKRHSARWPAQLPTGKDVGVDVGNRLEGVATGIEDDPVPVLLQPQLPGGSGDPVDQTPHDRGVVGGRLRDACHPREGNNEDVNRRLRVDVPECDHVVIAKDDIRLGIAGDDLVEDGLFHGIESTDEAARGSIRCAAVGAPPPRCGSWYSQARERAYGCRG